MSRQILFDQALGNLAQFSLRHGMMLSSNADHLQLKSGLSIAPIMALGLGLQSFKAFYQFWNSEEHAARTLL